MADLSDVEQAVVDAITNALYPAGPSHASVVGALCRVYRGWPNTATLNADLSAGAVNITVCSDNDSGTTTTRYLPVPRTALKVPGTVATISGLTITISGNPEVGDVIGSMINGETFVYRVQEGDLPDLIAANLHQLIQSSQIANLQNADITIPDAAAIAVRVVCDAATSVESRRQQKDIRVVCWCAAPLVRDAVAATVDAAIDQVSFLPLPDGTHARIVYHNTTSYDQSQNALLYRRDLIYRVEYATIATSHQPSMLFGASSLNTHITYG